MGCCVFPIKNQDIFDRYNTAKYTEIINLILFFFFISQHELCFMHNRTIENGLVYRMKTLRVLSFHGKLI